MKKQPDELFSKKLKGLQMQAPVGAWEKIDNNLSKKNNKAIWLKYAAAAVLVAGALSFFLFNRSAKVSDNQLSEIRDDATNPAVVPTDSVTKSQSPPHAPQERTPVKEVPAPKKKNAAKKKPDNKVQKEKPPVTNRTSAFMFEQSVVRNNEDSKESLPAESPDVNSNNKAINEALPSDEDVAKPVSSVMIVYNAAEVNEKYLNKKSGDDATPADEKESTLQKLLDKAYDLKHNQDPLGQLRQKKNEILALNFKKEKQRNQNR
jgi:hypothetical protein